MNSRKLPSDFFDLKERVKRDNRVSHKEVFGMPKKSPNKKTRNKLVDTKKIPKGMHLMPDGTLMKNSDMPKKTKSKKKSTKKKSSY